MYHALYPARGALYSSDKFARACGLPASPLDDLILINKMEPAWQRPGAGPVVNDVLYIALSVLLFGVIGYVHIWLGYNPFG